MSKSAEELEKDILEEISQIKKKIGKFESNEETDAMNRIAISNLYIALSNLKGIESK